MADPTTQSNYLKIATEHLTFDWTLDFKKEFISGAATHHLLIKEDYVKEVVFDTLDIEISNAKINGRSVPYELGEKHAVMGSPLHITLPANLRAGQYIDVVVEYKTTKHCAALQWLDKGQTQGKKFPFLFSQCQPIYARSIAPLQDSPSIKITYSAKVTSVLPVLLSAVRQSPPQDGPAHDGRVVGQDTVTYVYHQPVPIPSYLIAIAAGNLSYRPFPQVESKKWKSGIWTEPELIDAAFWEFKEDTTKFLAAEEKIITPYKFGVYDLLVLPPSFPYGGMENACLSFLTPTLLAGDRSLVDVVVHELTHSWFGNGVTHANASHFWLNEGWTTYIERVLQEILHGPAYRGFSYVIGAKALEGALAEFENEPKYQRLVIDFEKGENPDNAYGSIPYEKGANLILHIEKKLGGLEVFLPYVKDYVSTFMGKSITTQQWKDHLYAYWNKNGGPDKVKTLDSIDWNNWFYGQGPKLPVKMEYDLTLAQKSYALAAQWDAARTISDVSHLKFKPSDLEGFDSNQIIVFLEHLQSYAQLPVLHVQHIGDLYKLSTTLNAEIRFRFYQLAMKQVNSESAQAYAPDALNWIIGKDEGRVVGRMKFCRPIFRVAGRVNERLAHRIWENNKEGFHPIARKLIEKDLKLS